MKNLRGPVLALTLTLPLAFAGCGKNTGDDRSADKPTGARAALAASTSGLNAGNYAFTASTPDGHLKGTVHAPSKSAHVTFESDASDGPGKFELLQVEPD